MQKYTDEQIEKIVEERDLLLDKVVHQETILSDKEASLSEKDEKILKLENELLWLRRKVFGSTSERFIPADPDVRQLELFGDELTEQERKALNEEAAKQEELIIKTIKVKKDRTPRKDPSWDNLRVEEVILEPAEKDDEKYTLIGEDSSDKLAFIPGEIYIKRTIRKKYALKKTIAESAEAEFLAPVVIAPLPANYLSKSLADSSLISDILLQKYLYHMPFHRQIQRFKNMGVRLSSSTIGDWFSSSCEQLKPIYDELRKQVLSTDYIQVDESTIQVIDDDKRKTKKGYIWVVRDPIKGNVFFHYDNGSRSHQTARVLLRDFNGAIQSDGYSAYTQFENIKGKLSLGCWAHSRRKFEEGIDENTKLATEALVQIQKLYSIERQADKQNLSPEERMLLRKQQSYPILNNLKNGFLMLHAKF